MSGKKNTIMYSVVIPTYNRKDLALKTARQIKQLHPEAEVIVVEQKETKEITEHTEVVDGIIYITISTVNTSYAKNKGAQVSKGDIIFFFDDDVEITEKTVPEQIKAYEDSAVFGTSGRVLIDYEPIPKNSDVQTGKTNILGTKFLMQFWSTKKQEIDFPYGCNMSFRKTEFEKVGGFDERFTKIFEEIDLGVRIRKSGGVIQFVPEALAYHHKAQTGGTRTNMKEKMRMIYVHYGMYLKKHVPFPLVLISVGARLRSALYEAPFAVKDFIKGLMI